MSGSKLIACKIKGNNGYTSINNTDKHMVKFSMASHFHLPGWVRLSPPAPSQQTRMMGSLSFSSPGQGRRNLVSAAVKDIHMKRPHPGKINRNSSPSVPRATRLVCTLERRHRLALLVVQGLSLDSTEVQVNLAVGLLLPCEGVLHPVLVITLREVLTSVSTTGLLTVGSSNSGLGSVSFFVN